MDHWLSLYARIVALVEASGEGRVTLEPSSLGALQSLVRFFCVQVDVASTGAGLPPPRAITGPSQLSPRGWEEFRGQIGLHLDPITEEDGGDTLSIPDSLPELIDSVGEEEPPFPIGLVEKGIVPLGIALYQDSVRPGRVWLHRGATQ